MAAPPDPSARSYAFPPFALAKVCVYEMVPRYRVARAPLLLVVPKSVCDACRPVGVYVVELPRMATVPPPYTAPRQTGVPILMAISTTPPQERDRLPWKWIPG